MKPEKRPLGLERCQNLTKTAFHFHKPDSSSIAQIRPRQQQEKSSNRKMPALNGERPFEWSAELKRPLVSISAPGSPVVMSKLQTALTSPSGDGEADESQEFWQIRFTKEIYDDYEQYFQRIQLYRRPIWTCTLTGTRGLTFEEALVSERKAREHSQRIPRVLQRQLLERIQFSTVTRIDALTDLLHSQLNECYFVGEELQWNRGDGGERYVRD